MIYFNIRKLSRDIASLRLICEEIIRWEFDFIGDDGGSHYEK